MFENGRKQTNNWVSAIVQQLKMLRSFSNKQVLAVFQRCFSAIFHSPVNFSFNTCIRKTQDLLWPMPPYSIFWWIGVFHSLLLWFRKRRSIGHISVVLNLIWLKFWPKVRLASLLDCYFMKKLGTYWKNRVLVVFPVLREKGNLGRLMPVGRCEYKSTYWCLHVEDWYEGPFDWCRYLLTCSSEQVLSKTSKKVQQTCVSRFKPNLAQILAKGPPG